MDHDYGDFYNVSSFDEFDRKIRPLSNGEKGKIFEDFASYYFRLLFGAGDYYKIEDAPCRLLEELHLPLQDKGVDAVFTGEGGGGGYSSLQAKYRSKGTLGHREVSTYVSLHYYSNLFKSGVVFTSAKKVSPLIRREDFLVITYWELKRDCGPEFWENLRRLRKGDKVEWKRAEPEPFQVDILRKVDEHFRHQSVGRLIAACGTGKTLIGFWTAERLMSQRTLIIVPTLVLLAQTYDRWRKELRSRGLPVEFLLVGSEEDLPESHDFVITTTEENIQRSGAPVVISTYKSCHLLGGVPFDLIIYDEAHHTSGNNDTYFRRSLSLLGARKLFLTATGEGLDDEHGGIICEYTIQQAIKDGQLSDYRVVTCLVTGGHVEGLIEENKYLKVDGVELSAKLYKVASMISRALVDLDLRRLILYSNRKDIARVVLESVQAEGYEKAFLTGEEKGRKRKCVLERFENSPRAILSSVRVISEGLDVEGCDSVCFVEPRRSSRDIIQCIGRCLRKARSRPKNIAHILVPVMAPDGDDFLSLGGEEYAKIVGVLQALARGDRYVEEKILVYSPRRRRYTIDSRPHSPGIEAVEIDLARFRARILLKTFSRHGDYVDEGSSLLRLENMRRWKEGLDLLLTPHDCLLFLGGVPPIIGVKDWFAYALPESIRDLVRGRFYATLEEFSQACHFLGLRSTKAYMKKSHRDPRLPPLEYIEIGLYYPLDPYFNLQSYLLPSDDY